MGNRSILIIRGGAGAMPSGGAEWLALRRRDRRYDGKFVYAAVTTGIYCRPSCPARIPHRRNTLIFSAAPDAERQGYVPCRRCHPQSLLTPAERRITAALEYIEAHLDQPITLGTLSQISGASPHHFRELFQRIVGLSPKLFCDARRIARFKQLLRAGESISGACYQVGFGSSRALLLGASDDRLVSALREEFPHGDVGRRRFPAWEAAMRWLAEEDPLISKLPMNLRRRIFQARVWQTLA